MLQPCARLLKMMWGRLFSRASMAPERKRFSVCIPAYNRAGHLSALLDSVFAQEYQNFELVICEDDSSQTNQITEIVAGYSRRYPNMILYFENSANLGYDANIRNLVAKAVGEF